MNLNRDKKTINFFYTTLSCPLGEIVLTSDGTAVTGLYLPKHPNYLKAKSGSLNPKPFDSAISQLNEYFLGVRKTFTLPVKLEGTPFQKKVWKELLKIEYGSALCYSQVAKRIRKPGAARAVGSANQKNPISIIIPCHRVIGAGGELTGYSGGLNAKKLLLDLESR